MCCNHAETKDIYDMKLKLHTADRRYKSSNSFTRQVVSSFASFEPQKKTKKKGRKKSRGGMRKQDAFIERRKINERERGFYAVIADYRYREQVSTFQALLSVGRHCRSVRSRRVQPADRTSNLPSASARRRIASFSWRRHLITRLARFSSGLSSSGSHGAAARATVHAPVAI